MGTDIENTGDLTKSREPGATWLGHHDFGSARWVAWALLFFCLAGAVGSVVMALVAEVPIASVGLGVMCLSLGILMLPPALHGRSRSPGIKLGCVCLFLFSIAFTLTSVAGQVEPEFFEGRRGPLLRAISPVGAVLFFALTALSLRKVFRQREN